MSKKLLQMSGIAKRFAGVNALQGVDFELESGEVHALLGENGAGKSTLMKILAGIYPIDEGDIFIEGNKVAINNVKDAQALGISIIHQEISLVPHLSIAENIFLGKEPLTKTGWIDWKTMNEEAQRSLQQFGLDLSPTDPVSKLTVAQQQMVEIIKAVSFQAKIIVMDEPTSSLTEKEVEFLFRTIGHLKEQGVGIVYISHRMNELFAITDRITVLRDGTLIGTVRTKETTTDQLISMMVGRELTHYYIKDTVPDSSGECVLSVHNLSKKGVLKDVSFELRKGEILGFSGLVGAGRSELMKCIFGLDPFDEGEIRIDNKPISIRNPNDAIRHGVVYVTENRKEEGLFLIRSVRYNITIKILDKFIKWFKVNANYENRQTNQYIEELSIKTPGPDQEVRNLSGGNQQKVLISRWLATKPRVLILDEPTRGVDVGAKAEIYAIMNRLVKEGVSIIMISSELPEVINMSDRIAVMYKGGIRTILNRDEFSQETIMHYATGG